jgi:uncharacterized linocin/CFP29 family protein
MQCNPQVPWTEEQWARVNQAIQEEARRARVAASFLPLYGPLSPDTDFVRSVDIPDGAPLKIDDKDTIELSTLQLQVELRGAQLADPEMGSALSLFRRAANIIARFEDAFIFNGLKDGEVENAPGKGETICGGKDFVGLAKSGDPGTEIDTGAELVTAVVDAIGKLRRTGTSVHFPWSCPRNCSCLLNSRPPSGRK